MRRLLLLALLPLATPSAGAQIIGRGGLRLQQPTAWLSLGAGLTQPWSVTDGTTHSTWDFSDATQYSVALERTLSGGASLGVRGAMAKVPLRYSQLVGGDVSVQTDADATVSQVMGVIHVASGRTFHSVLELGLGATIYSGFRARGSDVTIGPDKPDADFAFAFGYGIGYAFSPAFSIDVVQDITNALHQRTGLGAGDKASARLDGTRLVARFGFGH